jgi:hypothetical protein
MAKLIRLTDSTHQELAERGKWGDTMNDIVQDLLQKTTTASADKEEEKVPCAPSTVTSPEGRKKAVQPPMTQERSET